MAESWHTTSVESTAVVMKALTHLDIVTLDIPVVTRDAYWITELNLAKEFVWVGYSPQKMTNLQRLLTGCTQSQPCPHTEYLLLVGQLFQE
ncbi:hypothetical protein NC969_21670 [Leptolyngbya subtilissima ST-M1]|uniref:hypothetical protein n=1 Tax=Cyanophyceae TaxID=3028117 RepID=UPI001683C08F|nr:hypothetical protein [Nodosilinea sp. FACHB-131]